MIAEFSDDGSTGGKSRIFYGLKANGRYFFSDGSPIWEIENIGDYDGNHGRYESLNQLVVTKKDLTRENEFLFSTSSYGSLTELHNNYDKTYTITSTKRFMGVQIYSFQYSMVEVEYNEEIFYYIAITYTSSSDPKPQIEGDYLKIKKFGFNSFSFNDVTA